MLCDSSRDSDSSPFYSDSDSSQFFSLWLGLGLRNRDSWLEPESRPSPSSSGRAVLRCLLWHLIHFVVCFHVLEDKQMLNMWTTRFVTRTQKIVWLGLGLWGDDSDSNSDFEVMTRTQRWWLRLGFDNLDSDTALLPNNSIITKCPGFLPLINLISSCRIKKINCYHICWLSH